MTIVLIMVFSLILWRSRICNNGYDGYMSRQQTQMINGIFIILVFMRHFNQYVQLGSVIEVPFLYLNKILGQLIVTTFMFYSGYGVMTSIMKEHNYVNRMPRRRIFKTMLLFDIAICLYVVMNVCLNIEMTWKQIILSFVGWEGVGNSTWYIFAILMMYSFTYIGFRISRNDLIKGLLITTFFIAGYILIIRKFKDRQYYNTVFCYAFGLWYAIAKKKIDSKILHNNNWWIAWGGAAIAFAICAYCRDVNLILNQFYYLLFVLVIVLLSMRIKLDSSTLLWCGQNLLGLYILQRIPMILCKEWKFTLNPYLSLFVCIVVTIVLAVAFRKYVIGKVKI